MFSFAIGILLPASDGSGVLSTRLEALKDLEFELSKRLDGSTSEDLSLLIWWHCVGGGSLPKPLCEQLDHLVLTNSGLKAKSVAELPGGLDRWLVNSQVVIQVTVPERGADRIQVAGNLLLERRLAHSLSGWSTVVQRLHPNADQSAKWQLFRGGWELESSDGEHRPLVELQRSLSDLNRMPHRRSVDTRDDQVTTAEALLSQRGSAWALRKSGKLMEISDRRLWLQASALAFLLVTLRQLLPTVVPELLVLLFGVWLLSRQPLRQRAQQWWCIADVLWIEDLWSCFALEESPSDWLPPGQPLDRKDDHGALVGLLKAHQLWLWLTPPTATWQRPQLVEVIEILRSREGRLEGSLLQHDSIARAMAVCLGAMAALMAVSLYLHERWLDQLLLLLGVTMATLWLGRPLPLVAKERLRQHLRRLELTRLPLITAQAHEDLSDPGLRQSVALAIRRVGAEVLDLCGDGLQSVQARRRWLP